MARKETSLIGVIFNALTGTGTSIRRTRTLLGDRKTIVHDHKSGTTKEYTHKQGLIRDWTEVKVRRNGKVVGKGRIKKRLLSGPRETIDYISGQVRRTEKDYNKGLFGNKDETRYYDAAGNIIGRRKGRHGLVFNTYSQEYTGKCYTCDGTGVFRNGSTCRKCNGTGVYRKDKK